jgi:hypothetical protein
LLLDVVSKGSGANRRFVFVVVSTCSGADFRFVLLVVSAGSGLNFRFVFVVVSTGQGANLRIGLEFSPCERSFDDIVIVSMGSTLKRLGGVDDAIV